MIVVLNYPPSFVRILFCLVTEGGNTHKGYRNNTDDNANLTEIVLTGDARCAHQIKCTRGARGPQRSYCV